MKVSEKIDIFDANLNHVGIMDKREAHMKGQWHKTFHCCVVTDRDDGAILFQLRSPDMANFPNMLDVSAAGHLQAGEEIEEGIREVSEELGIQISIDELHSLGYRVEVADQTNGQKNREYQAVYMLNLNTPLEKLKPQKDEIHGLLWIRVQDGLELFSGDKRKATMWGIRYNEESKTWKDVKREVTIRDFLPRKQKYYLVLCIMAERLLEKRFPLAIS